MANLEDEMSRFEAEIAGTPGFVSTNSYGYSGMLPGFGNVPPPPPPPMLIPHQVSRNTTSKRSQPYSHTSYVHHQEPYSDSSVIQPVVLSADPKIYTSKPVMPSQMMVTPSIDISALQAEVEKKLKKLKPDKVSVAAEVAISQGKASSALQSFGPDDYKRRGKNRKLMRTAGGQTWEDQTLVDWDEGDFRIFCGDLGNDVTDELLTRTFNKYGSFIKARVVRDKRTNKSKGFGFVSFKDPADFIRAMKEMNGRYVGSRPIKLRKSTWKNRNIDIVRKKEKEKTALINMLTSGSGR